jgi:hypothetical protein
MVLAAAENATQVSSFGKEKVLVLPVINISERAEHWLCLKLEWIHGIKLMFQIGYGSVCTSHEGSQKYEFNMLKTATIKITLVQNRLQINCAQSNKRNNMECSSLA